MDSQFMKERLKKLKNDPHSSSSMVAKNKPPKPDWMSVALYKGSFKTSILESTKMIECKGCHMKFKTCQLGKSGHEFAYYVHCMQECAEFRKLDLIEKCSNCKARFLSSRGLAMHSKSCL